MIFKCKWLGDKTLSSHNPYKALLILRIAGIALLKTAVDNEVLKMTEHEDVLYCYCH